MACFAGLAGGNGTAGSAQTGPKQTIEMTQKLVNFRMSHPAAGPPQIYVLGYGRIGTKRPQCGDGIITREVLRIT